MQWEIHVEICDLSFHLSVDHAYLGSNVRALALLTFIGYVNK